MHSALQDRVLEAHDRLAACATESARWDEASRLMGEIGVDWITAGTAARGMPEAIAIVSSTPASLMRDYIAARLHETDPWMRHCAHSTAADAADLENLPASGGLLEEGHALVRLLADHGVGYVCLSPAWRGERPGGIVTYCRTRDGAAYLDTDEGRATQRLLVATIAVWCRPEHAETGNRRYRTGPSLSPREIETLHLLSLGLRSSEIAWRMGIENVTVGKHVASARRKLGARTREQALAVALRDGLLTPPV
ncbi:autoinducer binding domain-containing protein [Roseicyclus sp.]|uniref:helix-turn-helix transcriptional regulator n=1 Tax=Roseicyclus sp. TaxID=1914329 RepID=UPI003F9F0D10